MEDNDTNWYGPDVATLGDRLAAAREAQNMSQEVLARRLGVEVRTLQNWEDDQAEPRANKLSTLAGLLNVSMIWLITGEGEGLADPEDEPISPDVNAILQEIRGLRAQFRSRAEKLGQLEKRLRTLLVEEGQ